MTTQPSDTPGPYASSALTSDQFHVLLTLAEGELVRWAADALVLEGGRP
jgi:hypothetical protein